MAKPGVRRAMVRTPARRRQRSTVRLGVFLVCACIAVTYSFIGGPVWGDESGDGSHTQHTHDTHTSNTGRHLTEDGSLYPPEIFSEKDLKRGAICLHAFGVIYTFIAIAIVCDDFFVPALEVLVEKYEIDDDVAGATFMAAGGSAPELFTALIGVFIAKSNVGFGTIIGSAVFNVLFVIGACAFFSREVLTLTWWPLARDCAFYVVDLVVLFIFFLDQKIQLYESLVLMLLYFAYVFFMKFNSRVERWFKVKILKMKESDFDAEKDADEQRKQMDREASMAHERAERAEKGVGKSLKSLHSGGSDDGSEVSRSNSLAGGLSTRNLSKKRNKESVRNTLAMMDINGGSGSQRASMDRPQSPGTLVTEPDLPSSPSGVSVNGTNSPNNKIHNNKVHAEPFAIDKSDSAALRKAAAERAARTLEAVASHAEEEDDEGIDLSWPEDKAGQVYFIIACPLMYLLAYTIPNVKKKKHLWPLVFFQAILYIGFFSYFTVWWATSVGAVAGISDVVMGYTFLAAGTSVPDLMSSVIVARQGLGDMAVSSSIGSNIFDITFGLPFPWIIWSFANNFETFPVNSDSLGFSLTLLIIMLVAVVSIIAQQGWMMTRTLGGAMVGLYALFLLLVLLNSGGVIAGF